MKDKKRIEDAVMNMFKTDRAMFSLMDGLNKVFVEFGGDAGVNVAFDNCDTALELLEMPIAKSTDEHDENGKHAPGLMCGDYFWDLWRSDSEDADAFLKECYRCKKLVEDELAESKKVQRPSAKEMLDAEMKLAKLVEDAGLRPPKIEKNKHGFVSVSLSQGCPHCPFSEWDTDECGACRALKIAQVSELSDDGYPANCPILNKGILVKRERDIDVGN